MRARLFLPHTPALPDGGQRHLVELKGDVWARQQKPLYLGPSEIGYVCVLAALEPLTKKPLWSFYYAPTAAEAHEMAALGLAGQVDEIRIGGHLHLPGIN